MRILITGANGQLAMDLRAALRAHDLIPLSHADLDITDGARIAETIGHHRPDVVINTAAYHKVDECESFPAKTLEVNAVGPRALASACHAQGATLVHISTNYVFNGRASRPYTEDDLPGPVNVYGVSKLAGEHLVRAVLPRHFIVRTTGLYGTAGSSGKGGNFVELMLRLARERGTVTVVNDQIMTPTYTADLAETIGQLITTDAYGTYHITNSGACSYYEFAHAIFQQVGMAVDLRPTTTGAYGAAANRPLYTVLDNRRWLQAGFQGLRTWEQALEAYLRAKGHLK